MSTQRAGNGATQTISTEDWIANGGLQQIAEEIIRTANITKRVVTLVEALTLRVEQLELPQVSPEVSDPQPEDFDLDLDEQIDITDEGKEVIQSTKQPHNEDTSERPTEHADLLRISIPQPTLLQALKTVTKAIPRSTVNPVFTNVKLAITNGLLTITATDGEHWIEQKLLVNSLGAGELLVPARLLLETVKGLPKTDLRLDFADDTLHIEEGGASLSVGTQSADEFPQLPRYQDRLLTAISGYKLKCMLKRAGFAAVKESSTRAVHYTNGVMVYFKDSTVDVVSTDGHRLCLDQQARPNGSGLNTPLLIPYQTARQLEQLLPDETVVVDVFKVDDAVFFEIPAYSTGSRVRKEYPPTLIGCKLIDVKFPDYERIIPKGYESKVHLDREALIAALKRVLMVCKQKDQNPVAHLVTEGNVLLVTADAGEAGQAEEKLTCEGGNLQVALNPDYLLDVLKHLSGDSVTINWQSEIEPVSITCHRCPNFIYILMPIRMD